MGGADKPTLPVGGQSMLTRVLAAVHDADPRVVVGRVPPDLAVAVHSTREDPPGGGPVAATSAGLALVPDDITYTALLAADLPLLTGEAIAKHGLDHERTGELVLVSTPDSWQAYYYWDDDKQAPKFARTVDIHRKPGYDPVELFIDKKTKSIPLDAKLRHEVRTDLRRLQSRLGLTTIFVTHDQDEALAVADRIVVMSAGKVEQVGTPREIYQRPASRFVAEFIGLTNIFAGSIEAGGSFLTKGGERFAVSPEQGTGGATAFAVRPEQISLLNSLDASPGLSSLPAIVEDVVYRGSLTEVIVRTNSGMPIVIHRQNADLPTEDGLRPGQPVVASWPAGAAMLF